MTHKVLKSCGSKMTTMEHDVSDLHRAYLLYIMPVGKVYTGFSLLWGGGGGDGRVPTLTKKLHIYPFTTKFLFPPTKSQFNSIKN